MLTGLSSGTAPELTAEKFAALVLAGGGTAADLRVGKGHRWEDKGVTAGLETVERAGVSVAFVGTGVHLGDGPADLSAQLAESGVPRGRPLKVFARPEAGAASRQEAVAAQISILADHAGAEENVLVETHRGGAGVAGLVRLGEDHGVRVVLDTLGLAHTADDPLEAAVRLAPFVTAAQVKGFDWAAPHGSRHQPLSTVAGETKTLLGQLTHARVVTVETRCGSGTEDLRLLTSWRPGHDRIQ